MGFSIFFRHYGSQQGPMVRDLIIKHFLVTKPKITQPKPNLINFLNLTHWGRRTLRFRNTYHSKELRKINFFQKTVFGLRMSFERTTHPAQNKYISIFLKILNFIFHYLFIYMFYKEFHVFWSHYLHSCIYPQQCFKAFVVGLQNTDQLIQNNCDISM